MVRIDSRELAEWMAFDYLEPFGDIRADLRQAITSCLLANIHRPKGKAPYKLRDFMAVRPPPEPLSPEQLKLIFKSMAGKKVKKPRKAKKPAK